MTETIAREFLSKALDHEPITEATLDVILPLQENAFLDFKGGPYQKKDAARTLRRYLSGFANADGGVVIFGVSDQRPRNAIGVESWLTDGADWAARVTETLLPTLGSPPAFQTIVYRGHQILIAAVDRGFSLVPCIEDGGTVYYVRSGDSTFEMPESLVADILLGRRRGPRIVLSSATIDCNQPGSAMCELVFHLVLENQSFGFASDLSAGIVTWTLELGEYLKPNTELVRAVNPIQPTTGERWTLTHLVRSTSDSPGDPTVRPFATRINMPFSRRARVPFTPAKASFAVFVSARDSPLQWFQCSLDWQPDTSPSTRRTQAAKVEQVYRSRPEVKWQS